MTKDLPKPATRTAFLVSTGITIPTPTKHKYVETRECELLGPGGGPAYEFVFECQETGMQRRWGNADVLEATDGGGQ